MNVEAGGKEEIEKAVQGPVELYGAHGAHKVMKAAKAARAGSASRAMSRRACC